VTIVLATCRQWRAMLLLPVAMLVEITGFLAVNYLVGRPRPGVTKIGPIPSTYSFPSGHVAATLVCWWGSALLLYAFGRTAMSKVLGAIAVVMTVMTGWARVYVGMHHTLDVAMGLVLGIAALAIAVRSLGASLSARSSARAEPGRR
jgi:undecaprenyl-diphosphatase